MTRIFFFLNFTGELSIAVIFLLRFIIRKWWFMVNDNFYMFNHKNTNKLQINHFIPLCGAYGILTRCVSKPKES